MKKSFIASCGFSLLLGLAVPVFAQSELADTQTNETKVQQVSTEPNSPNLNLLKSELSSVVTPSTAPTVLMGVATYGMMGTCCSNESSPKPITCSDEEGITWYNYTTPPSVTNFNLLTIIFSSLPPLPAQWTLAGVTQTVANTTVVLDKTSCPSCFSGTAPTSMTLSQIVNWNTVSYSCPIPVTKTPPEVSDAYPAQTWSIGPVVLIYQ